MLAIWNQWRYFRFQWRYFRFQWRQSWWRTGISQSSRSSSIWWGKCQTEFNLTYRVLHVEWNIKKRCKYVSPLLEMIKWFWKKSSWSSWIAIFDDSREISVIEFWNHILEHICTYDFFMFLEQNLWCNFYCNFLGNPADSFSSWRRGFFPWYECVSYSLDPSCKFSPCHPNRYTAPLSSTEPLQKWRQVRNY